MASQPPSRDPDASPWAAQQEQFRSRTLSELQRQLDEAQAVIRRLTRELNKEQSWHAETSGAYTKTVKNMVEIARENAVLSHELERLKRAGRAPQDVQIRNLPPDITPSEAKAIRKAMARLHHPDVGGNEQRMKLWNVTLDQLDSDA